MSVANLPASLFTALSSLVSNRVYPITFPLATPPIWPAIRYTIVSNVPSIEICGDGGDLTADARVQLDLVANSFAALRTLRASVMTAMVTFVPPTIFENSTDDYDAETKTYRTIMDYMIYASS